MRIYLARFYSVTVSNHISYLRREQERERERVRANVTSWFQMNTDDERYIQNEIQVLTVLSIAIIQLIGPLLNSINSIKYNY